MAAVSEAISNSTLTKLVASTQQLLTSFDQMEVGKAVYSLVDLSLRAGFLIGAASASGNQAFIAQVDRVYEYVRAIERKLIERLR